MLLAQQADTEALFACCFGALGVFLIVFWFVQFFGLMGMPDSAFPGRNDKLIWALVLIFLSLLGAILFWFWKQTASARSLAERDVRETLEQASSETQQAD